MTTDAHEALFEPRSGQESDATVRSHVRLTTLLLLTGLALILAFNVLGSLYWVRQNVVLVGHDASEYLWTSIEYNKFLTDFSPQTLFRAFTFPAYRTPAIYLAVQPFFWLFGVNMDSAQLLNVMLLGVVIVLTYLLGNTIAGRGIGLFAALLVGLFPLMAAMSRLFYTEMFLTALVVLNLLALHRLRGFTHRSWSLVWGASLGIGLLVKWTIPLYVWLPLLWYGWQSGALRTQIGALWRPRVRWRGLLVAAALGGLLSSAWFWPNRTAAQLFPLGSWLWLGWFVLLAVVLYASFQRSTPVTNSWAALVLALTVASLWYLPHANFAARLLYVDEVRGQEGVSPLALGNVVRYGRYFYEHHLGALAFWVIVPAAMAPWLMAWVRRRTLNPAATPLWLSIVGALVVLIVLQQQNPRNLAPFLPIFAILATVALWSYPRLLRYGMGAVWLPLLVVQWGIFTFDGWYPLYQRNPVLWVRTDYSKPPSTGETDPGYWIGPQLLETVSAGRDDTQSLGVLVNTHQVHRGVFRYLIAAQKLNVGIRGLTTEEGGNWSDLLASQWVLLKDGDNRNVAEPGLALLARIHAGDPLFAALYTPVERFHLPDGDTLTLYHRSAGPGWPEAAPEQGASARAVAEAVQAAWSDHARLLYASPDLAVWVGMYDPAAERVEVLPAGATAAPAALDAAPSTLLAVSDYTNHALLEWLDAHAYRAATIGDDFAELAIYGKTAGPLTSLAANASWGEARLESLRTNREIQPGKVLPVEVAFSGPVAPETKVSLRLLGSDSAVIASNDFPLAAANRLGLFVPPQTPPGSYELTAIVYDATTMATIADQTGESATRLAVIHVQP